MAEELPKNYDPSQIEGPIFQSWYEGGYFHRGSEGAGVSEQAQQAEPYTIVIPPPNVTGVLHMGHALNNTLQDICTRRARMQGRNTRWIVGTDHAGIATQNKVEQKIAAQGKTRFDLGREAFVDECWDWRDEHGSIIIEQLKRMGCSCDYDDEQFTMSPEYQDAVRHVFVKWYRDGLVYKGHRIINWCPRCTTALADDEVEHEDEAGHLWYLRYPLKTPIDGIEYVTVATTRPETMLGDTAVAVNPKDERYTKLVGATVILPIVNREIPIIADEYVDMEFGTGFVKMTPAHDPNDFEVGLRHDLEQINVFDETAHVNELGGEFAGMDRFEARDAIVERFIQLGLLDHIEDHEHAVGHCYRCHTTIEPWLSDQWFVSMKPLAKPAIEAVRDGRVKFNPSRWENVYFHWMENIRDWCISRQLWWGHRIPVFYCDACGWEDALDQDATVCPKCGAPVRQDEDVLDTWFSSQLWPFATMGWPREGEASKELREYYPTQVLSTARDIIFLWVARMVMSSMYFCDGQIPFKDVIIHPTVLDSIGRRMSKSLGNGIDPIKLIELYGADGMRFGLALQVTGAQDMKFDDKKLEGSRNFATKIWNAARFVLMNLDGFEPGEPSIATPQDAWILSRLATLAANYNAALDAYDFGEAARLINDFFWNEFCDWYIEFAKGRLQEGGESRKVVQRNLVFVLDQALRLLHPIMPYVTTEIWDKLPKTDTAPTLMVAAWPDVAALSRFIDPAAERSVQMLCEAITAIRATRARYGISPRTELRVALRANPEDVALLEDLLPSLADLARTPSIQLGCDIQKPQQSIACLAKHLEVFVVVGDLVDFDAERARISKEIDKTSKELERIEKKLSNPGFLAKAAPEIIAKEQGKQEEVSTTLGLLKLQLAGLQ
ncbi:MAG: valine--tRNA ligase [Coriobacteriales bacterium]|nr:valine--tRNA ligase [Coriobacteriales bacterium]